MYDATGSSDVNYWVARNLLRSKFGLTSEEADNEPAEEVYIHLKIWELVREREQWEADKAERRSGSSRPPHQG